eukprot:GHVT01013464.1.p1 GENE.GHVT01013464.1~~GHVT01013464.1.p1  ORF type:complete len:266 (+),score=41.83 GHVT01013464.1:79-876(+)
MGFKKAGPPATDPHGCSQELLRAVVGYRAIPERYTELTEEMVEVFAKILLHNIEDAILRRLASPKTIFLRPSVRSALEPSVEPMDVRVASGAPVPPKLYFTNEYDKLMEALGCVCSQQPRGYRLKEGELPHVLKRKLEEALCLFKEDLKSQRARAERKTKNGQGYISLVKAVLSVRNAGRRGPSSVESSSGANVLLALGGAAKQLEDDLRVWMKQHPDHVPREQSLPLRPASRQERGHPLCLGKQDPSAVLRLRTGKARRRRRPF